MARNVMLLACCVLVGLWFERKSERATTANVAVSVCARQTRPKLFRASQYGWLGSLAQGFRCDLHVNWCDENNYRLDTMPWEQSHWLIDMWRLECEIKRICGCRSFLVQASAIHFHMTGAQHETCHQLIMR